MSDVTWLPEVLRAAGLDVKTYKGWKNRGRPGAFAPFGLLLHHTGTTTSDNRPAPSVGFCITGSAALTGPLCHIVAGFDGVMHVIAAGRANHAGTNDGTNTGPIPAGDGNAQMIGIEIDYSGSQDMGPKQYEAVMKASAAIVKHLKKNEESVRGHKETSAAGKWDPGRRGSASPEYLMGGIRTDIRKLLEPPKIVFAAFDGDTGAELVRSAPFKQGWRSERAGLARFERNTLNKRLAELRQDGDVVTRRKEVS